VLLPGRHTGSSLAKPAFSAKWGSCPTRARSMKAQRLPGEGAWCSKARQEAGEEDCRGIKLKNSTDLSSSDPDAFPYRKSKAHPAQRPPRYREGTWLDQPVGRLRQFKGLNTNKVGGDAWPPRDRPQPAPTGDSGGMSSWLPRGVVRQRPQQKPQGPETPESGKPCHLNT
jgi:hypothetical protein